MTRSLRSKTFIGVLVVLFFLCLVACSNVSDESGKTKNDNSDRISESENESPPEQHGNTKEHNSESNFVDENERVHANVEDTANAAINSEDEPRTLTIGVLNLQELSQSSFRSSFTQMFEWDHPNVEIEFSTVIGEEYSRLNPPDIDSAEELKKLMTGDNPPDVLFLSYNDYRALMEEGLLVALDPLLKESDLSLDDFEPIVADGLVNPIDHQTYGLTPYFTASALIYNKDLFDEMNLEYPRDHMTWDEVFSLAKHMTFTHGDKNVYGLIFDVYNYRPPMLRELWRKYIPGLGVQVYDKEAGKMAVNNEKWHDIFADFKDLYDAGVFPLDQSEGDLYSDRNKFYSGTIAMAVVEYSIVREIINAAISAQNGQRDSVPNWDIVSMPVHLESPHVGAGVVMEPVIAINANGKNQLDAFRLIESIHSKEWAHNSEETTFYRLSSRKDYAVNMSEVDYNKAALYQLRPPEKQEPYLRYFGLESMNDRYLSEFYFSDVLEGKMAIEEALAEWEDTMNNMEFIFQ